MKKVIFAACLSLFAFTATAANKPCSGKKGGYLIVQEKSSSAKMVRSASRKRFVVDGLQEVRLLSKRSR
ncbi:MULTISPECIES: hypothetical protein [Serratia]|uniref:hypothetical protein n=1 Tax=Serratia TaxID=613 RepID=UPI0018D4AA50|nr:hypothetical protein [Serratia marcescens]MBH1917363.1 hypothetical protein [Serratia marcescens]MBH2678706.1 hypothetical protein [Serratia marcescens]MBN3976813.1 hypothetical protein [Serratia marcescens]